MRYPCVNVGHATRVLHCNLTPLRVKKGNSCRSVSFVLKKSVCIECEVAESSRAHCFNKGLKSSFKSCVVVFFGYHRYIIGARYLDRFVPAERITSFVAVRLFVVRSISIWNFQATKNVRSRGIALLKS